MNITLRKWFLTISVALAMASPASAESLDSSEVAADAKWLVHLNVDEIRYTALAQDIQQRFLQAGENQGRLDWVQDNLGINLRSDLHGLTFYGRTYAPQEGVGLVHAEYGREKVVAYVKKQPQHKTVEHRDYTIHEWRAERGGKHHNMAMTFHDEGTIVLSGSIQQAKSALDVLDGRQAALKNNSQSPLTQKVPGGTFFRGSAIDLQQLKSVAQKFPVLGQAKQFALSLSEKGPNLSLDAKLVAVSDDVARQLAKAVQGFAQASSGRKANQANGSKSAQLLKQFEVERDGATLSSNAKIDREAFLDFLQEAMSTLRKKGHQTGQESQRPPANSRTGQ